MAEVGSPVATFADWKREMLSLADSALDEGRLMNAAFAYRAAELYTVSNDPKKEILYERFIELFSRASSIREAPPGFIELKASHGRGNFLAI